MCCCSPPHCRVDTQRQSGAFVSSERWAQDRHNMMEQQIDDKVDAISGVHTASSPRWSWSAQIRPSLLTHGQRVSASRLSSTRAAFAGPVSAKPYIRMDAGRLADYAPAIAGSTILFEILSKTSLPAFHASFGAADRPALPKKLSAYLTSTVHALISVAASVALLATPSNIHEDRLFGTDRSTTLLLSFSAGYFLHDLIDSIQRFSGSRSDVLFVVHHVVSLYIYASAALLPVGQYWCCTFLVYEASTPFLNWQGFLRDVRWGSTGLLTVAKIMFAVTFIAVRIVYGTAATFLLWKDLVPIMTAAADGSTLTTTRPVPHVAVFIVYFVLSVLFMMLNAYWGYMIVQKIRRAISKRKSS